MMDALLGHSRKLDVRSFPKNLFHPVSILGIMYNRYKCCILHVSRHFSVSPVSCNFLFSHDSGHFFLLLISRHFSVSPVSSNFLFTNFSRHFLFSPVSRHFSISPVSRHFLFSPVSRHFLFSPVSRQY